ncbi:hypothetical protein [Actinomyces ruminis]|uniref:Excreted virulence factor EspC, type VII ESX diderm n=1 Tax=Actinomyces ruminis TaxID=1937003 RepID=A0ABX4MDF9_9ACTO|nr:hypothetical protein [Actinomyces ruminis]PHP52117.1 hypothetical protein BW737_011955 [Actinomyces ruminis]
MSYSFYAGASADGDDEDGSSDLVDNLKKQAIEKVRGRAGTVQEVLANDPQVLASTLVVGAVVAAGGVPSSSYGAAGGLSAFSGQLGKVWSSPLADDFGTDIDTSVTAVRDVADDIYEKANNAWWGQEDRVPKGSDEANSEWR